MTRHDPPRLALAILRRYLDDDEPLTGDLIEGFALRPSKVWFWREVLAAVAMRIMRRRDVDRPLGLTTGPLSDGSIQRPGSGIRRSVNLTASPLPGVGGLGLLAFAVLVMVVNPGAVWIFVPALAGGVVIGVTLALVRRRSILKRHATTPPALLHEPEAPAR